MACGRATSGTTRAVPCAALSGNCESNDSPFRGDHYKVARRLPGAVSWPATSRLS